MKKFILVMALVLGIMGSTVACTNMNKTQQGALSGGAIGALGGAGIAAIAGGSGTTGALIGGAAGAITGAIYGHNQ